MKRSEIPLRLLAILQVLEERYPGLLAALKKEFDLADLAEDSERPVSDARVAALGAWLHRRTGNRSLGFELGVHSPPNATGPLGAYLTACPSLATALGELAAFYPLVSWDGSRLWATPHARGIVVEISGFETRSIEAVLVKDLVLGRLLMLARRLAGPETRAELIVYPETELGLPAGLEDFALQVARAPKRIAVLFADADVQRPARYPGAWLVRALKPKLDEELEQLGKSDSLSSQVRQFLASLAGLADVSQAVVAKRFHLSESSLKRRLAEEETTFSDLLQGYRRSRALELLTGTADKLDAIALILGFSERASFERAFRQWFDMTPASYREQIRALGDQATVSEGFDPGRLPSSPRVSAQILELLNRDDYALDELVRLVALDPLLSARIMALACSAWYGARAVRDLRDAIGKVLGVDQVRYLALISAANTQFNRNLPPAFDLHRYWRGSLLTAGFVAALHPHCGAALEAQGFELYLAALLCDIGSFMFAHLFPERMQQYLERSGTLAGPAQRRALELELFGASCRAAGALLLAHWNLPRASFRIVRELDEPDEIAHSPEARLVRACAEFALAYYPSADEVAVRNDFVQRVREISALDAGVIERIVAEQDARATEFEALVRQLVE